MINQYTLSRIRSQSSRAGLVLFTGAGFSCSAKNRDGLSLPSTDDLKKEIWRICFRDEPFDTTTHLGDLYEVAHRHKASSLRQLLELRLRVDPATLPDFYLQYIEHP